MQKHVRGFYGALLVALALWLPASSTAAAFHGRVVGIADSYTVTALDAEKHRHKIRLAGIDAPEKAQAFSQASKKSFSDMIYGHEIDVN